MEIKLFIYDNNLRPDRFISTFKLKEVSYEPCFNYVRLIKTRDKYIALEEGFSNFPNFTFGTLYTFDCSKIEWENIKLYYTASGHLRLVREQVRTISFNSIEDFISQKFEVTSIQDAHMFVSDLSNDHMKIISANRHMYAGNLCPEFLQTYKH